jgi:hypothetical protein
MGDTVVLTLKFQWEIPRTFTNIPEVSFLPSFSLAPQKVSPAVTVDKL